MAVGLRRNRADCAYEGQHVKHPRAGLIKVGSSRITPAECFSLLNSSSFRAQGAHQHPVVTNLDSAAWRSSNRRNWPRVARSFPQPAHLTAARSFVACGKMTEGDSQSGQRRSSVIGCSALLRCSNVLRRVMFLPVPSRQTTPHGERALIRRPRRTYGKANRSRRPTRATPTCSSGMRGSA
jgi:hypothetical protein